MTSVRRSAFRSPSVIGHQPDVGRLGDQHAAVEDLDRSREHQPIGEDRALVHAAVGIGVFEHDDAADRLVLVRAGQIGHEAGHLDDPEPAARVPVHRHRFLDQWLAGDELDAVAGRHVERLQRLLGGSGGDSGGIFCTSGGQGRLTCELWKAEAPATAAAVATVGCDDECGNSKASRVSFRRADACSSSTAIRRPTAMSRPRRAGDFSRRPASPCSARPRRTSPAPAADPIIDIHQHLNYSGRSDAALLAHQIAMGATTTVLLPAGRPLTRPSTHEGKSNGLEAQALGNEACWQFARTHRAAYRFAANEVPDIPEARSEIERYLRPRRRNDCRTEIRCRVRFAGDAAHLRARPGAQRAGADALAVREVQQGLRAIPPHAREIPAGALHRPRADLVGEHRQEPRRPEGPLPEGAGHRRAA